MTRVLCKTEVSSVICRHCGSVYERKTVIMPWLDQGVADCEVCGRQLQRWNGHHIRQFRLLRRCGDKKIQSLALALARTASFLCCATDERPFEASNASIRAAEWSCNVGLWPFPDLRATKRLRLGFLRT